MSPHRWAPLIHWLDAYCRPVVRFGHPLPPGDEEHAIRGPREGPRFRVDFAPVVVDVPIIVVGEIHADLSPAWASCGTPSDPPPRDP